MKLSHLQLRKSFADFWLSNNHKEVPPIPLVPQNDPTTLFTGSGMQQLVPYLLGESHALGNRLYNIQPCFRSQDIEEIGDNRHTTFFEMMGNWSLGDYFKKEQLAWFWEFLTSKIQLPKEKLYVSVFAGTKDVSADNESFRIWKSIGVPENRIFKYGPEKNWWSRAGLPENMPAGEPGGPDSEVFYDFGEELQIHEKSSFRNNKCHPNCDCGRFLEIGNSVFMQYKKEKDGSFSPLPKMNVDFGGGLERILAAANNDPDIFNTDLYSSVVQAIEAATGKKYLDQNSQSAIRTIADHLKASIFIIQNNVLPSNKEHGYFLRRLLRRMTLKMRQLKNSRVFLNDLQPAIERIFKLYDSVYLKSQKTTKEEIDIKFTLTTIGNEISRFGELLEKGVKEISQFKNVDGKFAFYLYQSYGFPLEITEEILKQKGEVVDKIQFKNEFEKHKNLSRSSSSGKFKGGLGDNSQQTIKYHTATHLLHQALFDVLGSEVRQEGSNITGERLRFDFYSNKKPTEDDVNKTQTIINEKIKAGLPVVYKMISRTEGIKLGAKSFFREKYPDTVKIYFIGDYSKEFCGGPHVSNTKEIEKITIYKFEKIGSNLYRIYAK